MESTTAQAPLSIDRLTELARVSFDPSLSIKSYLRTCDLLYQRAKLHESRDDEIDLAFIYLFRAANNVVQDLPSHPDYDLLPAHAKFRIQAVGIKYLRALAPVKAKLKARSKQPLENQPPAIRPDNSKNASIASAPTTPSYSATYVPQTPTLPLFSSSSTVSRSVSSSRTLLSSKDLDESPSSLSSSSRTDKLRPDASRSATLHVSSKQPGSPDSLDDWTILPSSASIPVLETWHPLKKKKSFRRRSEPVSHWPATSPSTTTSQPERNPLVWPVELGNGQGQPMSIALPVDEAIKNKPTNHHEPRRSNSRRDPGPSPHFTKPGLLLSPSNLIDRYPHQQITNRNKFPQPGAISRNNPQELYGLQDPGEISPKPKCSPSPLSPDSYSNGRLASPQSPKSPLSSFSRAVSTDDFLYVNQSPTHPSNPTPLSALKSFIRPRRTSWSYSKSKTKASPSASSLSVLEGDRLPNPISPSSPSPPRPRRASLGESSPWRWLKGLNIKSSDKSHPKRFDDSNAGPNLYSEISPATEHDQNNIKVSHPLSRSQTQKTAPSSSTSNPHQTHMKYLSSSSMTSPIRPKNRPPIPPKDPRMKFSSSCSMKNTSFQYHSPNRTSSSHSKPHVTSLRSLKCPNDLVAAFLAMAEPETQKGIELCGLLLGKLHPQDVNVLVIDTLLIPKQISGPDTCHTINEDELFKFQDQMGLMTLGWIHTHPTQTCFLSSLDLHTHLSYQLMLPEAVAIVCSPKKQPSLGVFRLIDPEGIRTILNCKQSGSFHPHPLDAKFIYCHADDHFKLIKDQFELDHMKLDIRDLR